MKILLAVLLFSGSAFADLRHETDRDLMNEMWRRGYSCSNGVESYKLVANCDQSGYLKVTVYDLDAYKKGELTRYMAGVCTREKARINQKNINKRLSRPGVVAFCDQNHYLVKLRYSKAGIDKKMETIYIGSEQKCIEEAEDFNSIF